MVLGSSRLDRRPWRLSSSRSNTNTTVATRVRAASRVDRGPRPIRQLSYEERLPDLARTASSIGERGEPPVNKRHLGHHLVRR